MLLLKKQIIQNSIYWTPHLVKKLLGEPDHITIYKNSTLRLYCPERINAAEQTAVFRFRKRTIDEQLRKRRFQHWQHKTDQADLFAK